MHGADAGVEAELLGLVDGLLRGARCAWHSSMKAASSGFFSAAAFASGWSGATAMNFAPNSVSGRVV